MFSKGCRNRRETEELCTCLWNSVNNTGSVPTPLTEDTENTEKELEDDTATAIGYRLTAVFSGRSATGLFRISGFGFVSNFGFVWGFELRI